jgi:uncharacterized protein YecT (DUF1311 family)
MPFVSLILLVAFLLGAGRESLKAPGAVVCPNAETTVEMVACLDERLKATEKVLETHLTEARRIWGDVPEVLQAVNHAQEAWTKFRESQCDAETEVYKGGSIQPVVLLGCWQRLSGQRICEIWSAFIDDMGTELPPPPEDLCR